MRHLFVPLRLYLLISMSSAVRSSPASHILVPRDTCSDNNLNSCGSDLPSDFCCPDKSSCVSLAGGTTAICCPTGSNCDLIQPITCDVSRQDPDKFPSAPIKTNVFNIKLETCGEQTCCPFGFSCIGGKCNRDDDQSVKPGDKPSASTTTRPTTTAAKSSTATDGSTTASPSTEGPSVIPTDEPSSTDSGGASTATGTADPDAASSKSHSASTTSIIGGVVGGCVILLIIAILVLLYIRRSKRRNFLAQARGGKHPQMHHHPGGSQSGSITYGNVISGPISQPGSYRTDFIRKELRGSGAEPGDANGRGQDLTERLDFATEEQGRQKKKKSTLLFPRISIPNPFSSPNPSACSRSPTRSRFSAQSSVISEGHPPMPLRTGTVTAKLAPIRAMKASSRTARRSTAPQVHLSREPSSEDINIFADPETVGHDKDFADLDSDDESDSWRSEHHHNTPSSSGRAPRTLAPIKTKDGDRLTRGTTFTELMEEAQLGQIHKGKQNYVPGATPRI